jgi:hypothetical protein
MSMTERRLDIMINWMVQNPTVVTSVQKQLVDLGNAFEKAKVFIMNMIPAHQEQAAVLDNLGGILEENTSALMRQADKGYAMADEAMKRYDKEQEKVRKDTEKTSTGFTSMGYRLGWLGFRISIMGRMIERFGTEPIAKMTNLLKDWEGSLETLALALGMQEAGLGETGLSAEQLRSTMAKLIDVGPALQTAWLGLEATWIRLAVDNAPALISILASLQSMLEGTGGVIITYIISTVAAATAGFAAFVNVLGPVAPIIGVIVGVLVAMSPALIAIGMALFMLQPIIALNTLLHGAWATTLMTVTIPAMWAWITTLWAANAPLWALSTPLLVWVVAIGAVVAALAILYFKWNDIVTFLQNTLGPVLNWIGEKIKWLSDLVGGMLGWLGGVLGFKPAAAAMTTAATAATAEGAGGETQQNITVYSNPYIANVEGVADLDEVYKASDKGVTDALDKRSYPGGVVP